MRRLLIFLILLLVLGFFAPPANAGYYYTTNNTTNGITDQYTSWPDCTNVQQYEQDGYTYTDRMQYCLDRAANIEAQHATWTPTSAQTVGNGPFYYGPNEWNSILTDLFGTNYLNNLSSFGGQCKNTTAPIYLVEYHAWQTGGGGTNIKTWSTVYRGYYYTYSSCVFYQSTPPTIDVTLNGQSPTCPVTTTTQEWRETCHDEEGDSGTYQVCTGDWYPVTAITYQKCPLHVTTADKVNICWTSTRGMDGLNGPPMSATTTASSWPQSNGNKNAAPGASEYTACRSNLQFQKTAAGSSYNFAANITNADGTAADNESLAVSSGNNPAVVCSPATQTVKVGETASFTATNGDGAYRWSASDGTPPQNGEDNSANFSTQYSTTVTKTVTVTSDGKSASCLVTVNPAPTLTVNLVAATDSTNWQSSITDYSPLNGATSVDLKATVGGTAGGPINYTFYCDRGDTDTNITSPNNAKDDGKIETVDQKDNLCPFPSDGIYHAKVIVERGSLAEQDQVTITLTTKPNVTPMVTPSISPPSTFCSGPMVNVGWTYSDPDNNPVGTDPQSAYRVQLDTSDSFVTPIYDTQKTSGSITALNNISLPNQFNKDIWVRVMVWDSHDHPSNWSAHVKMTDKTTDHAWPSVAFYYLDLGNKKVHFGSTDDSSKAQVACYKNGGGSDTCQSWAWDFDYSGTFNIDSTAQNPDYTYPTTGDKTAKLLVTDKSDFTCPATGPVQVKKLLPNWKEIVPRF